MPTRILAVAFVLTLAVAPFARAQGTQKAVPYPITGRDLERWTLRLGLSVDQQEAIGRLHEAYLAEFRTLREGEIETVMQTIGDMFRGGFRDVTREQIEATAKTSTRLMSQIKNLEDRFFESMRGTLSTEQAAMLPRIMDWRARQRFETGAAYMVGRFNAAARVDLGDLYDDLELTAVERQATEPILVQYEGRLTALASELYKLASGMFLEVSKQLEAQKVDLANIDNVERAERDRLAQAMEVIWTEAAAKPREQAHKISDLNRQTMKQLTALLSPAQADQLQGRYLRRAYSEVPRIRSAERALRTALQIEGLPEPTLEDIDALSATFRTQRDVLVDEAVEYIDEYRRQLGLSRSSGPGRDAHREQVDEFRDRFDQLDDSTVEALRAMLGPDGAAQLKSAQASNRDENTGGGADRPVGAEIPVYNRQGPDAFIPPPISEREVTGYRTALGFSDEERFILESLYEDYRASWQGIRDTDVDALSRALGELRRSKRKDEVDATPADVSLIFDMRRQIMASMVALDRAFFDDLEPIVRTDPQRAVLRRLRLQRECTVYNRGLDEMEDGVMSVFAHRGDLDKDRIRIRSSERGRESSVDVAELVARADISADERASLATILEDYSARAVDAFRAQYETILRLREEAEMRRHQPRDENRSGRERREATRQALEVYRARVANAADSIIALNQATFAKVSEELPAQQATELRWAYNRWAFPRAYDEEDAAVRHIEAARMLPGLDAERSKKIEAINGEHRASYETTCEKLVSIYREPPRIEADSNNPDVVRMLQERRSRIDMLEFDRTEATRKAIRQLRSVLDEHEQARIGLKPLEDSAG